MIKPPVVVYSFPKMCIKKVLFFKILALFIILTNPQPIRDDTPCTKMRDCPHIEKLFKTGQQSYGKTSLLFLLYCNSKQHNEIYVKCIDEKKLEKLVDSASLIPNYDSCGLERLGAKIAGGQVTQLDDHPWVALLKYGNRTEKEYFCHGNLIAKRYLLTAAHCVHPAITMERVKGNISSVVLGEYNITSETDCIRDDCADPPQEIPVEAFHIHPNYNDTPNANDIALIRLSRDVKESDFVKPICLPPPNLISPFNETLLIAGWGPMKVAVQNPVKVEARFALRPKNECEDRNFELTSSQFCARSTDNATTCPGDSGGPLMMRRKIGDQNRLFLVGVDSLGWREIYCFPNKFSFSIYTKVASYIEWILATIHK